MTPAAIHASMSQSGDPTLREMSAETMKMPDPIIDPATSIVASVSVMALTNPADDDRVSSVSILSAVLAIRRLRGVGSRAEFTNYDAGRLGGKSVRSPFQHL